MDVSSVKSSSVDSTQRAQRTDDAQRQAQSREARQKESDVKPPPEAKPAPVINTQGQATGQLLNVSA